MTNTLLALALSSMVMLGACSAGQSATIAVVEAKGLRDALDARKGKAVIVVTFASWAPESLEAVALTAAELRKQEPAPELVLLAVDMMQAATPEIAQEQVGTALEALTFEGLALIWSGSEATALDLAFPLSEGRKLSKRLPSVVAIAPSGAVVGVMQDEITAVGLAALFQRLGG